MDEAEQCGRIALMRTGKLIALDTPDGLKSAAFPRPVFEFDPIGPIKFEELSKLQHNPVFSFFEPYGLRFHASVRDEAEWDRVRPEFEKTFRITRIKPTLEDVFIRAVEGKPDGSPA